MKNHRRTHYLHNLEDLALALDAQQRVEPETIPTITIKRDYTLHSWVYMGMGAHPSKIACSDETPVDVVVRYLKTKANGHLNVLVDLS